MSTQSRRYLLTMWEGGGTIPPELGVAKLLLERGHEVHVLGDPTIREAAEAAGCQFRPWRQAPHSTTLDPSQDRVKDWEVKNPLKLLGRVRDKFIAEPTAGYATDTRDAIESVHPSAVLPDSMLFGSIIAAQGARLPVAALMPNIWMVPTRGVPVIGPGFGPPTNVFARARNAVMLAMATRIFDRALPTINAVRDEHGLLPLSSLWSQVRDVDRIFVLTSETFDFAAPFLPDNVRYVGPVLDDPGWAASWTPPWPAPDERPLALVALSSTFQDQAQVLQRIVDALEPLPVRAIVTLGQMLDPGTVASTENVAVVQSGPHSEILRQAAVAITHCGHGTTMKALAAGVPLVCIPMGRDQNDTAARVVHQGAGVRLSPGASVGAIRDAVTTLIRDGGYRDNAARMASVIAAEHRPNELVAELEWLAGSKNLRRAGAGHQAAVTKSPAVEA